MGKNSWPFSALYFEERKNSERNLLRYGFPWSLSFQIEQFLFQGQD